MRLQFPLARPVFGSSRCARALVSFAQRRLRETVIAPLLLVGFAKAAHAQDAVVAGNGKGFDTHLFRPALDSKGFFTVNGTEVLGAKDLSFGLVLDYGNALLRVPDKGQSSTNLIEHSFQGTVHFNYGIANRLSVGISAPVNLLAADAQYDRNNTATVNTTQWNANQLDAQSLSYLAAHAKFRILRVEDGFGLSVAAQAGTSLGSAPKNGAADPGFWYWPQLLAEKRFADGVVKIGLNAGFRGHSASGTKLDLRNGTFVDGSRGTFGGAVSLRVAPPLDIVAESYGTYLLSDADANTKLSAEAVGGIKLFVERNSYLMIGGGKRLTGGFEAAEWRGFLGFVFEPSIGDTDGDGIKDDIDKCPLQPEDFDGFEDDDGCPDPDNDKDGIPDVKDRCINEPEDKDGDEDWDGCPESRDGDRDHDGIPDTRDKCPDVPEDKDGVEDDDGCPDDNDKDGIPDSVDKCPMDPEDKDGFEDEDGCPEPDNDKDGIPDVVDKCPLKPETFNGIDDEDGCPDKGDVEITDGGIVILKKIQFKTGSAEILPASNPILDAVAAALKGHPEFLLVEVAGHADERDDEIKNLKLTQKRVDSVVAELVKRGVASDRLRAKGYGEYCPEDPGHNEKAWEKNRRVEFKIVKNKDNDSKVETGCDNADQHGVFSK